MKLTKKFTFEAAHCLDGHDRGCNNVHGHSYKLFVTFEGNDLIIEGPSDSMLMDFGKIKEIINCHLIKGIDHTFMYNKNNDTESKIAFFLKEACHKKVVEFNSRTTCENMIKDFFRTIDNWLSGVYNDNNNNVHLEKLVLYETEDSFAEYTKKDYDRDQKMERDQKKINSDIDEITAKAIYESKVKNKAIIDNIWVHKEKIDKKIGE